MVTGQKTSKNFNRQMDIPAGVMAEDMVAELSSDGILSIEAPVDEEEAEKAKQVCVQTLRFIMNSRKFCREKLDHSEPQLLFHRRIRPPPNLNFRFSSSQAWNRPEILIRLRATPWETRSRRSRVLFPDSRRTTVSRRPLEVLQDYQGLCLYLPKMLQLGYSRKHDSRSSMDPRKEQNGCQTRF